MAYVTSTVIGIISLVAAAAGSAVSYNAQQNAAKSAQQIAFANAQAQTQAARQQGKLGQQNAQLQAIKAQKDAEARYANAEGMKQQVEVETRNAQKNIDRQREDFQKQLAIQRSAIASKGIVDSTGSPLDLLVHGAEDEALLEQEMRYSDELNRSQGLRAAEQERVGGYVAGLDVGMSLLAGAAYRNNAAIQTSQAQLDLFGARAQSAGMRGQATAGLLSSAGSIYRDYSSYRRSATPSNKSYVV